MILMVKFLNQSYFLSEITNLGLVFFIYIILMLFLFVLFEIFVSEQCRSISLLKLLKFALLYPFLNIVLTYFRSITIAIWPFFFQVFLQKCSGRSRRELLLNQRFFFVLWCFFYDTFLNNFETERPEVGRLGRAVVGQESGGPAGGLRPLQRRSSGRRRRQRRRQRRRLLGGRVRLDHCRKLFIFSLFFQLEAQYVARPIWRAFIGCHHTMTSF